MVPVDDEAVTSLAAAIVGGAGHEIDEAALAAVDRAALAAALRGAVSGLEPAERRVRLATAFELLARLDAGT